MHSKHIFYNKFETEKYITNKKRDIIKNAV